MPRKSPYTTAARCFLFQYNMDQYTLEQSCTKFGAFITT